MFEPKFSLKSFESKLSEVENFKSIMHMDFNYVKSLTMGNKLFLKVPNFKIRSGHFVVFMSTILNVISF